MRNRDRQLQIRFNMTNHEIEFVKSHIQSYYQKIKNYHANLEVPDSTIKLIHTIFQFRDNGSLQINAYENFGYLVKMLHELQPVSRIFFVGEFENETSQEGLTKFFFS